jgi:nitrate/TMAO reductase-like tetraheme cytochrome c subunit
MQHAAGIPRQALQTSDPTGAMTEEEKKDDARVLGLLRRPSRRWSVGALLGIGLVAGFLLVATGAVALRYTNTLEFCISCHSMRATVYQEYKDTPHYNNAAGVRATCSDCHVPEAFGPLMVAKVLAVADVYHEIVGSIDTPEKFESRRWLMANKVWRRLERTDSGTCRSCHDYDTMDLGEQDKLSRRKHKRAAKEGTTCIECHRGLAHKMPREPQALSALTR